MACSTISMVGLGGEARTEGLPLDRLGHLESDSRFPTVCSARPIIQDIVYKGDTLFTQADDNKKSRGAFERASPSPFPSASISFTKLGVAFNQPSLG